jgi:hypothetical protein
MSLFNAKQIGAVCKRDQRKREYRPMVKLIDQIPESTQEMIWLWYQEGMTRRQMSAALIELGVPSPPMTVPWGDNAIRVVIEKYKLGNYG